VTGTQSLHKGNNISTCVQVFLNVHNRDRDTKFTTVMSLTVRTFSQYYEHIWFYTSMSLIPNSLSVHNFLRV